MMREKTQLSQASWNTTVLKFGSEKKTTVIIIQFFFVIFPW